MLHSSGNVSVNITVTSAGYSSVPGVHKIALLWLLKQLHDFAFKTPAVCCVWEVCAKVEFTYEDAHW